VQNITHPVVSEVSGGVAFFSWMKALRFVFLLDRCSEVDECAIDRRNAERTERGINTQNHARKLPDNKGILKN
jgi:hypothetical protein